jgi:hypothetical protein
MPIKFKKEPTEVNEAIKTGLSKMSASKAFSTPQLRRATLEGAETPTAEQAIPIYSIGLSELSEGKNLGVAKQNTWRYLVRQSGKVVANADIAINPEGKQALAQVNEGPLVAGTTKAIEAANAQEKIKSGQYEVRILMIPALYVAALWLVDSTNKIDFVMPVEPTPPYLQVNKLYQVNEFMVLIQKAAKEKVAAQPSDQRMLG